MKYRRDLHPLSINFKKLSKYKFDKVSVDEIVFFEWLILKQKCFGENTEFYYQTNRIIDEIGIKRSRLETIKSKFLDYGLAISRKGILNVTHYHVSLDFVENYVRDHIIDEFQDNYLIQVKAISFKGVNHLSESEVKLTMELIQELNYIFNEERRDYQASNGKVISLDIELNFNNKTIYQLNLLRIRYTEVTICNSFTAFICAMLEGKDDTSHLLNNFSSYDHHMDGFPVFGHYNRVFGNSYNLS